MEEEKEHEEERDVVEVAEEQEETRGTMVSTKLTVAVIIGILFLGLYVFYIDAEPTTTTYNGYIFEQKSENAFETTLLTNQGDTVIEFRNHPSTVENISYNNELSLPLRLAQETNGTVYISISEELSTRGEAGIAALEISRVTSYIYGVATEGAFMQPGIEPSAPVITCENATPTTPVITMEQGNQTEIGVNGTCIQLRSDEPRGLIEAADALVYRLTGVIESE